MQINNTTNTNPVVTPPANNNVAGQSNNAAANPVASSASVSDPEDILELSGQTSPAQTSGQTNNTSNNQQFRPDFRTMGAIWNEHDRQVDSFRRLVEGLLNQQIERSAAAGNIWDRNDPNAMVEIDEATRTSAQQAIGEGGYFSVEATASRLLSFAVAISGGDPSRIEVLRNAVERGFEAAERQWGGELPEISQQTREAVMNGFDQWAEAGNANAITLLNPQTSPMG